MLCATSLIAVVVTLSLFRHSWQVGIADVLVAFGIPSALAVSASLTSGYGRTVLVAMAITTGATTIGYINNVLVGMKSYPLADSLPDPTGMDIITGFRVAASWFRTLLVAWAFAPFVALICLAVHLAFKRSGRSE
jgi:hypothetical protein